jgi:ElaB/YqjD/DUF883 family membrane-anchored ribosome-binding protein
MPEFEDEVKKAEKELSGGLIPVEPIGTDEFLGDLRTHAEEYGQQVKDVASRAFDFANEKWAQAEDKLREISDKDPRELVEDAKEFARQKPGQTILISAAIGLVFGALLRGGRRR